MTTSWHAILDCQFSAAQALELESRLGATAQALVALWSDEPARGADAWCFEPWAVAEWREWHLLELQGPRGWWFSLFPGGAEVGNGHQWGSFLSEPGFQRKCRDSVRLLARATDASRAIYVPSHGTVAELALHALWNGASLQEILAALGAHFGPPAASPSEILRQYTWDELQRAVAEERNPGIRSELESTLSEWRMRSKEGVRIDPLWKGFGTDQGYFVESFAE
ncbi:MAG TPA: hypothetical protein VNN09_10695 [Candidatus Competibacteraceae bacterium]|nr:hypothetical protein [Candidatus Competibacteraceae bacterium]